MCCHYKRFINPAISVPDDAFLWEIAMYMEREKDTKADMILLYFFIGLWNLLLGLGIGWMIWG
ncbi:MAG TPA: hypothetical protein VFT64_11335 [Rickettsiales bacterium]|nr:hypothetical protein [Rickettsiales bacterium]